MSGWQRLTFEDVALRRKTRVRTSESGGFRASYEFEVTFALRR